MDLLGLGPPVAALAQHERPRALRGVAPRETATAATPAHRLRFASFDGLVVEARLDKRESKHYLTLDFKAADGAEQSEALRVELDRLREQVQPWTFELSDYDGGSFALLRADLLEQAQAAEPAAEAPAD